MAKGYKCACGRSSLVKSNFKFTPAGEAVCIQKCWGKSPLPSRSNFHKIEGWFIRTTNEFPPIPDRSFDWSAIEDNTYDGEGCPIGRGSTEQDAINDLVEQLLEERYT